MLRFNLAILAVLSGGVLSGCGIFNPDEGGGGPPPPPPPPTYQVQATPGIVLENLRAAYEARDSVEVDSIYAADYHGESTDLSDPPGTNPLVFTQSDERGHVGGLRRNNDVLSVTLDMGTPSTWVREESKDASHPEWASITLSQHIKLEIQTIDDLFTVGSNDFFEFQFAPTTPAASSQTDTTWSIVRWREVKGAGG